MEVDQTEQMIDGTLIKEYQIEDRSLCSVNNAKNTTVPDDALMSPADDVDAQNIVQSSHQIALSTGAKASGPEKTLISQGSNDVTAMECTDSIPTEAVLSKDPGNLFVNTSDGFFADADVTLKAQQNAVSKNVAISSLAALAKQQSSYCPNSKPGTFDHTKLDLALRPSLVVEDRDANQNGDSINDAFSRGEQTDLFRGPVAQNGFSKNSNDSISDSPVLSAVTAAVHNESDVTKEDTSNKNVASLATMSASDSPAASPASSSFVMVPIKSEFPPGNSSMPSVYDTSTGSALHSLVSYDLTDSDSNDGQDDWNTHAENTSPLPDNDIIENDVIVETPNDDVPTCLTHTENDVIVETPNGDVPTCLPQTQDTDAEQEMPSAPVPEATLPNGSAPNLDTSTSYRTTIDVESGTDDSEDDSDSSVSICSTTSSSSAASESSSSDDNEDSSEEVPLKVTEEPKTDSQDVQKKKRTKRQGRTHLIDGELLLEDLPPIEDLHISVPEDQAVPIGTVFNIVEQQVVVQAYPNIPAIDLDSVLFLDHGKRALGHIFDVFGQVHEPLYVLRFNSSDHIKSSNINTGDVVYFAPTTEHTSFIVIDELMRLKGSDAVTKTGNEVTAEDVSDFSDDEEEARALRMRSSTDNFESSTGDLQPRRKRCVREEWLDNIKATVKEYGSRRGAGKRRSCERGSFSGHYKHNENYNYFGTPPDMRPVWSPRGHRGPRFCIGPPLTPGPSGTVSPSLTPGPQGMMGPPAQMSNPNQKMSHNLQHGVLEGIPGESGQNGHLFSKNPWLQPQHIHFGGPPQFANPGGRFPAPHMNGHPVPSPPPGTPPFSAPGPNLPGRPSFSASGRNHPGLSGPPPFSVAGTNQPRPPRPPQSSASEPHSSGPLGALQPSISGQGPPGPPCQPSVPLGSQPFISGPPLHVPPPNPVHPADGSNPHFAGPPQNSGIIHSPGPFQTEMSFSHVPTLPPGPPPGNVGQHVDTFRPMDSTFSSHHLPPTQFVRGQKGGWNRPPPPVSPFAVHAPPPPPPPATPPPPSSQHQAPPLHQLPPSLQQPPPSRQQQQPPPHPLQQPPPQLQQPPPQLQQPPLSLQQQPSHQVPFNPNVAFSCIPPPPYNPR